MYSVSGHVKLLNSCKLLALPNKLARRVGAETRALESHRDQSFDLSNLNTLSPHSHSHSHSNFVETLI